MSSSTGGLSRGGRALTTLAMISVGFTGPHAGAAARAIIGADFPHALLGLASLVQLVIGTWVLLIVGLAKLFGSAAILRATTPRIIRGALFAGTAGALAIAPAHADRGIAPPGNHTAVRVTSHSLAGLPYPDRPISERPHPSRTQSADRIVIVRPGDTLWAIARRFLPDDASESAVARSCAEWFVANRAVIGNNPDLIIPAQRLRPPTKEHS